MGLLRKKREGKGGREGGRPGRTRLPLPLLRSVTPRRVRRLFVLLRLEARSPGGAGALVCGRVRVVCGHLGRSRPFYVVSFFRPELDKLQGTYQTHLSGVAHTISRAAFCGG
jgi:hypothetical protein